MNKIIIIGSINADHVLQVSKLPLPGETVTSSGYQIMDGGKGANQAVAACRMGSEVSFIGCTGNDNIGHEITSRLTSYGIDTEDVCTVEGCLTGTAMIFVDPNGENCIGTSAGANNLVNSEYLSGFEAEISMADIVLMQLETPIDGLKFVANEVRKSGAMLILNPAPYRPLADEILANVDIITPNLTEAESLTGVKISIESKSLTAASDILHNKGIPTVIITLGRHGVWYSSKGQGILIPGNKVDAVDSTAAGDCFNGALTAAIHQGKSIPEAIVFAQVAASISVTREGAQISIPEREEIESQLMSIAI